MTLYNSLRNSTNVQCLLRCPHQPSTKTKSTPYGMCFDEERRVPLGSLPNYGLLRSLFSEFQVSSHTIHMSSSILVHCKPIYIVFSPMNEMLPTMCTPRMCMDHDDITLTWSSHLSKTSHNNKMTTQLGPQQCQSIHLKNEFNFV